MRWLIINPILENFVEKIKAQLIKIDFIEGIVIYGSWSRKEIDFYSDLDIIVYYDNENDEFKKIEDIKNNILIAINENTFIDFYLDGKWIIYAYQNLSKLEIKIKSIFRAIDDIIFIAESRIFPPNKAIAFDRSGKISKIYNENWIQLNNSKRLKNTFIDEMNKFLYYYDGFLTNMARDDEYRAYMNYTIAFYKLVSLMAMVEGKYYNIYQPENFTTTVTKDWGLRQRFYKVSAGLRKYDMYLKKDLLLSFFCNTLKKGKKLFKLDIDIFQIKEFFKQSEEKYPPFKNFRDIGLVPNTFTNRLKIKKGLIFRSASLSKYDSKYILKFLRKHKIKRILDLRGIKELENYRVHNNIYSKDFLENFVIQIPIEPEVETYIPNNPTKNFYYAFLREFRNQIKLIFEKYFVNVNEEKLIIHCEGGKDRTGIIIAILLDVLGVEREIIINDYLLSYSDTKRNHIEFILNILNKEYNGTENFLVKYCKISNEVIQKIRNTLLEYVWRF